MAPHPDESAVRDALCQVMDPEAGLNIVDLGLVYGIEANDHSVRVALTMSSAACPMTELIVDQAREAIVTSLAPEVPVHIDLVWDPPWTPARMSDVAREQFGWAPR